LFSQIVLLAGMAGRASIGAGDSSPRSVVEAKFEAVNRHAVADVVAYYAPGARLTASDFCGPRQGLADVQRTYLSLFAAFDDAQPHVPANRPTASLLAALAASPLGGRSTRPLADN
jgi:hypothetical protein